MIKLGESADIIEKREEIDKRIRGLEEEISKLQTESSSILVQRKIARRSSIQIVLFDAKIGVKYNNDIRDGLCHWPKMIYFSVFYYPAEDALEYRQSNNHALTPFEWGNIVDLSKYYTPNNPLSLFDDKEAFDAMIEKIGEEVKEKINNILAEHDIDNWIDLGKLLSEAYG